jgi:beta-lactamase regulating signal transducer with metallopeptidase domain
MNPLTPWLIAFASRGATELIVLSWQALVLVLFAWTSLKVSRVNSPRLRHQVWLFCLIAVSVLPIATPMTKNLPAVRAANVTLNYVIEAPRTVIDLAPQATNQTRIPSASLGKDSSSVQARALPFVLPLLFSVWFIGALLALMQLAKNQIRLRRIRRRAQPITLSLLNLQEDAEVAGIGLLLSTEVESPLMYGIFRPVILLPGDIAAWTSVEERNAMIQHELAHIERLDPIVNLFQTSLRIVLFFHPLVRYACQQLSLERELACDERVVVRGTCAEVFAEGLLKVAERRLTIRAEHQLAFASTKQTLERRIEMILNFDRVRAGARHWKLMTLFAGLIAVIAWLLIPLGGIESSQAQLTDRPIDKARLVRTLGNNKAFDELIEMALRNPDTELRRLAALRLIELEGDGSTAAMVALYNQTNDPEVKIMLIDTFASNSEMEVLVQIASSDANTEYRLRALRRIKFLKADSESTDIKDWDVSQLTEQLNQVSAEPPPPPAPPSPLDMLVQDKSQPTIRGHKNGDSVFTLLRGMAYAAMRHDASFFERVLDDSYRGTMSDGSIRNKAQEIAEATRRDRQITEVQFDEFSVTEEDGKVVANVAGTVHARVNGEEAISEVHYTVRLLKANGQMKITAIERF